MSCLALLAMLVVACAAVPWTPQAFPNPTKDVRLCGRNGKPSWICDPDHVLTEYSADVVEGTINEILQARDPYRKSPCPSLPPDTPGYQVPTCLMLLSLPPCCNPVMKSVVAMHRLQSPLYKR